MPATSLPDKAPATRRPTRGALDEFVQSTTCGPVAGAPCAPRPLALSHVIFQASERDFSRF